MGRQPFAQGRKYKLKIGTSAVPVWLEEIRSVLDASSLDRDSRDRVEQYEVGECVLETAKPIAFDLSADIAQTGRFVIVDNYEISGGGIILEDLGGGSRLLEEHLARREASWQRSPLARSLRAGRYGHQSAFVLLAGPDETALAELGGALEAGLLAGGRYVYYLGLKNALLGVSQGAEDRGEALRRLGETAHLFTDSGAIFVATVPELEATELAVLQALAGPADAIVVVLAADGSALEPDLPPAALELPALPPGPAGREAALRERAEAIVRLLAERRVVPEYYL
jgi:bifunctional enzyme CysN/CysC